MKTFEPSPPRERSPTPGFVDAAAEALHYSEHPTHGIAASRGEGEVIHIGTGVRVKDHVDENVWVAEEEDVDDRLDEEDEEVVELVMDNDDMLELLMVEKDDVSVILEEDKQDEEDDEEVEEQQHGSPPLKWEEEDDEVDDEELEDIDQESDLVVQGEQNDSIKKQCDGSHAPVQIEVTEDSARGTGDSKCDEEGQPIIGRGKGDVDVVGEDVPECKADTQDRDGEKLLGGNGRMLEASFASGASSMTINAQENLIQKHGDIETISPPEVS